MSRRTKEQRDAAEKRIFLNTSVCGSDRTDALCEELDLLHADIEDAEKQVAELMQPRNCDNCGGAYATICSRCFAATGRRES